MDINTNHNELPKDFNYEVYNKFNKDLSHLSKEEAINHFIHYGKSENRRYSIIPKEFDYKIYLELNPDVACSTEKDSIQHYIDFGYAEERPYKIEQVKEDQNKMACFDNQKLNTDSINNFARLYNTNVKIVENDDKMKFRYLCYVYLEYIRQFTIPPLKLNLEYEAVLLEFRMFPHIEFILRNNILKLGNKWSFTIICGKLNYEYMKTLCKSVSPYIKIINVEFENLLPSEYSLYLSGKPFWNLLKGRKVLIYQEDSIIFKTNIDQFLYYDYIGAPWPAENNGNVSKVGNGGLSLRTKRIMEKIIDTRDMNETKLNSHTIDYMKRTNSFVTPEDVYFTKNMEDLNIGRLAPFPIAKLFSQESVLSEECFGGHNFWLSDSNWEKKMTKYNIIQFKPNYNLSALEHRGGWKYILQELYTKHFFSNNSTIDFFDVLEQQFLWKKDVICFNKWIGIIHCTPKTPNYLKDLNIEVMFQNPNFVKSLKHCVFLITLSPYITNYLKKKINIELNLKLDIYTLYHPVVSENIPLFNISNFIDNSEKTLIQIGQQLRKITTIYFLKSNNNGNYKKLWLTGCKDFKKMEQLLEQEMDYFDLKKEEQDKNVQMYYTETFEEYDMLLTKNIVIVHLFDAAANNTILECIIRNTPVIVNRIEGVIDYLGEDYPLYFDNITEIDKLLDIKKIKEAHLYLKKMDKRKFHTDFFITSLYDLTWKHFMS